MATREQIKLLFQLKRQNRKMYQNLKKKKILPDFSKKTTDFNNLWEKLSICRKRSEEQIKRLSGEISNIQNCPKVVLIGMDNARWWLNQYKESAKAFDSNFKNPNDSNFSKYAGGFAVTSASIGAGGAGALFTIASTFGTASTGAAISSLSGVAATNAALAWLGGGAVAAGGAGVAGGSLLLTLIGPVGWAVGLVSGLLSVVPLAKELINIEKSIRDYQQSLVILDQIEKAWPELQIALPRIQLLTNDTEKLCNSLEQSSFLECSDYNSDMFPHEKLFSTVNDSKKMAKLLRETLFP
ncbi:MAG: hypothetical protein MJZ79_05030 [Paludibacteraceae bacterium]|nr:hypothetical protein [Paludibacteraceae bacterium]